MCNININRRRHFVSFVRRHETWSVMTSQEYRSYYVSNMALCYCPHLYMQLPSFASLKIEKITSVDKFEHYGFFLHNATFCIFGIRL